MQVLLGRTRSAGVAVLGMLAALLVAGCGSEAEDGSATGGMAADQRPCVVEGYPCDLDDVPPEVVDATMQLGAEADALFAKDPNDPARVVEWLLDQDQVVAADATVETITWRLEGGSPARLLIQEPAAYDDELPAAGLPGAPTGEAAGGSTGPAALRPGQFSGPPPRPDTLSVVPASYRPAGEPGQGHDDSEWRSAVVIEPFGPMTRQASGTDYAERMKQAGSNLSEVIHVNGEDGPGAPGRTGFFDAITTLGQHELVHISSHGWSRGLLGPRMINFNSGQFSAGGGFEPAVDIPEGVEIQLLSITYSEAFWRAWDEIFLPEGVKLPEDRWVFSLPIEFWTATYPQGLPDTLFFADWCRSAQDPDLASVISGHDGGYLGWTANVTTGGAAAASSWFWSYMTQGVDVDTALAAMGKQGLTRPTNGVELVSRGANIRSMDAVTSFIDEDTRISSGLIVDWLGDPGDGVPDHLPTLRLEVVGVPVGEAGRAQISLFIDGEEFPATLDLSQGAPQRDSADGWDTWILEVTDVELPFDVTEERLGTPLGWEVRVTDQTDTYAAHVVDGIILESPAVEASHPESLARLALSGETVFVDGTEDDGEPGSVPVVITVHGVKPKHVDQYVVRVRLSGGTLASAREFTWPLNGFAPAGEKFRKQAVVPLDRDLTDANDDLTIATTLHRNDEEVSAHSPVVHLEGKEPSECAIDLTWSGAARDITAEEPFGKETAPPLSGEGDGPDWDHEESEAGSTYGRDKREGEDLVLLIPDDFTGNPLPYLDVNADDVYGSPPANASPYYLTFDFGDEIAGGATGTFTVPHTDSSGMELIIKDLDDGIYVGPMTVTITKNTRAQRATGLAVDSLAGTFDATLADSAGAQLRVNGSFSYGLGEC